MGGANDFACICMRLSRAVLVEAIAKVCREIFAQHVFDLRVLPCTTSHDIHIPILLKFMKNVLLFFLDF